MENYKVLCSNRGYPSTADLYSVFDALILHPVGCESFVVFPLAESFPLFYLLVRDTCIITLANLEFDLESEGHEPLLSRWAT